MVKVIGDGNESNNFCSLFGEYFANLNGDSMK